MTALPQIHTIVLIAAAAPVVWAAVNDLRDFRIPNECSLALLALYPLHAWLSPAAVDPLTGMMSAAAVFAVTYAFYAFDRFGGGDVKLLSVLALWAGPALLADLVVITTLTGGVLAVVFMTRARFVLALALERAGETAASGNVIAERLPYGVAIAVGGLVVFARLAV